MELRQLRYFVAVAEELYFGRAAARLGIEQSPLSKAIKVFEEHLDVRLLATTTRRTELTPAGTLLLAQARQILMATEHIERRIKEFANGTQADIAIGLSEGLLNANFSVKLRRFSIEAPVVRILVKEMSFEQQLSALDCPVCRLDPLRWTGSSLISSRSVHC